MKNAKVTAIALALIAISANTYADSAVAGKTRAEVRAELEQAYAQGELRASPEYVEFTHVPSAKSRAQVRAELGQPQARPSPEYVEAPQVSSGKTRAEVRAELEQAYAQGELGRTPEFVEFTHVASSRSRDEVRAEAAQAAKLARQHAIDSSGR